MCSERWWRAGGRRQRSEALRSVLVALALHAVLAAADQLSQPEADPASLHRARMFKFALFQDLLVILSVLKMMLIEGYSFNGVIDRVRWSGPVAHAYLATAAMLHAALLLDEPGPQRPRLRPARYTPSTLHHEIKDLFLL